MTRIPRRVRTAVSQRAGGRCEYCRFPAEVMIYPFHVDHVIPLKHGGASGLNNLAWACLLCNLHKGTDLTAFDSQTQEIVPLFNPRTQEWNDHFESAGGEIVGITPTGRATAQLLRLNSPGQVDLRLSLMETGRW